jgi:hypothetical protein
MTIPSAAMQTILEGVIVQAVLDDHYAKYPGTRLGLDDLAVASAELDGHPLAAKTEDLRRTAVEIVRHHPDAAEDVLVWGEARSL